MERKKRTTLAKVSDGFKKLALPRSAPSSPRAAGGLNAASDRSDAASIVSGMASPLRSPLQSPNKQPVAIHALAGVTSPKPPRRSGGSSRAAAQPAPAPRPGPGQGLRKFLRALLDATPSALASAPSALATAMSVVAVAVVGSALVPRRREVPPSKRGFAWPKRLRWSFKELREHGLLYPLVKEEPAGRKHQARK